MIRTCSCLAASAAILLVCAGAVCGADAPDDVLVETSTVKLTRGDYEADLQRVPADMRNAFASDPSRLTKMLNNILVDKTLAAQARQAGVDRDPQVARIIALETDRILANMQLQRLDAAAGAEFDAKQADFLLKAREMYTVGKDKYRAPEEVKASHILFETRTSTPETALARANEARAKLLAGADFATLAKEISDDPSARVNDGELGWFGEAKLDPAFTKAAFALQNVGEISQPVRSSFGYHLIRFEGRRPPRQLTFDEVKDTIMAQLRAQYISDQQQAKIASIRSDPTMKVDQAAVDGLVYQVDPDRFKRALPQQTK
jgi:peptidyl-prolyl cis-trans isomerase C